MTKKKKTAKKYSQAGGYRLYNPEFLVSRRVYRAALKAVNRIRAKMGNPPLDALPFGMRNSAVACPIAKALASPGVVFVVGRRRIGSYGTEVDIATPRALQEFIGQFDKEFE